MSVPYDIQVIKAPGDGREHALARSLDDALRAHGLHLVIDLRLSADEPTNEPSVVVFLGSAEAVADDQCRSAAQVALDAGRVVVPVASAPDRVGDELLPVLSGNNAWIWDGPDPANRLARLVLEELGIEENQRRVFISHRRLDGLLMAEQLHDELSHRRFQPFIDRFAIPAGAEVQDSVADALESFAFLLLLESPFASGSEWVFYEVEYALVNAG